MQRCGRSRSAVSYGSFQVIKEEKSHGSLLVSMQVNCERIYVFRRCFIGIGEGADVKDKNSLGAARLADSNVRSKKKESVKKDR